MSEIDRLRKNVFDNLQEIERLRAREQECIDKYLNMSKYASEMEGKYILEKAKNKKANWWLKEMLKQAKSDETKAIINGTLELLLNGGDKDD